MSFAATVLPIVEKRKTVTRRTGWDFLEAGEELLAVDVSPRVRRPFKALSIIQVTDVRREPVRALLDDLGYGFEEVVREGFPALHPEGFVQLLLDINPGLTLDTVVTRIAFTYVPSVWTNGGRCPRDTDGDGDCGQLLCPYCGGGRARGERRGPA